MKSVQNRSCEYKTMLELSRMINDLNPFAMAYRMLHDVELLELRTSQLTGLIINFVYV